MSFLDRLIRDPFYQQNDPRPAEKFEGGYHMRGVPWAGRDGERFRWQGEE